MAVKQRLGSTEQFPSGWVEQPGASCYTAAERLRLLPSLENVTLRWPVKRGGTELTLRKRRASRRHPTPTPPSPPPPRAEIPYLVEVGGPGLSLRGLSFICQLFVCSVLHCHTALANLPNEPQELHDSGKNRKKKKQQKERKEMTARTTVTNANRFQPWPRRFFF